VKPSPPKPGVDIGVRKPAVEAMPAVEEMVVTRPEGCVLSCGEPLR
jgi:hypothetical protein